MLKRFALVLLFALSTTPLGAEVVRIEVNSRADILPEKSFGSVGGFEKLAGKIYFAVDPRNTANQIITDIDKAPQNSSGKVEFSSDFYMIKPKDMSRGNGTVLYEVSNRGNKGMLGYFNRATVNNLDPKAEADFGDGFLLAQGFTLLWVGWQFDAPSRDGMLWSTCQAPVKRMAVLFAGWSEAISQLPRRLPRWHCRIQPTASPIRKTRQTP
jgi:hypothetical protein